MNGRVGSERVGKTEKKGSALESGGVKARKREGGSKEGERAKKKSCSYEGCDNRIQSGGVCWRHGANATKNAICSSEGCTKRVRNGGVCVEHGATVAICSSEGCDNQVRNGGVCLRHFANSKKNAISSPVGVT